MRMMQNLKSFLMFGPANSFLRRYCRWIKGGGLSMNYYCIGRVLDNMQLYPVEHWTNRMIKLSGANMQTSA